MPFLTAANVLCSYVTSVILGADVIPHLSAWSVEVG